MSLHLREQLAAALLPADLLIPANEALPAPLVFASVETHITAKITKRTRCRTDLTVNVYGDGTISLMDGDVPIRLSRDELILVLDLQATLQSDTRDIHRNFT